MSLSTATTTTDLNRSEKAIATTYNRMERADIANYGCESGTASEHIYYHQTTAFFNEYQDEIEDYFYDRTGDEWLENMCINKIGITGLINTIVWSYVEAICNQLPPVDYN